MSGANITAVNFTASAVVTTHSLSGTVTGLSGVTMTLSGASSATTTTDASGNYTFGSLADGSYTITPTKTGYTFTPASSPQTLSGANITTVNFTATGTGQSYTNNGNGTITQSTTGLVWQQQDDGVRRDWATAGTYCAGLALGGYSGWRLPTKDELVGIVETSFGNPAINTTYFTNTKGDWYWSSTTDVSNALRAWDVVFSHSQVYNELKGTVLPYTRCVRP